MKRLTGVFFAAALILGMAFAGETYSTANAQATVVKKTGKSIWGKTKGGAKYVYRKGSAGTRYVYRKGKQGTVYVGKQTWRGGKWTYSKGKSGAGKVVGGVKKIVP